jgi:hypothetical protein
MLACRLKVAQRDFHALSRWVQRCDFVMSGFSSGASHAIESGNICELRLEINPEPSASRDARRL